MIDSPFWNSNFEQQQALDGFWVWTFGFQVEFLSCFGEKVPGKILLIFPLMLFLNSDVYFYMVTALGISAKHLPDMQENLRADLWNKSSGSGLG